MLRERALSLSLQYNFVTELTSLIVVEDTNSTMNLSADAGFNVEGINLIGWASIRA